MQRLLCILSSMNAGGAETFLMKIYRRLDHSRYQMDFCINAEEKCFYEDEIIGMGGRIFRIPPKTADMKGFQKQLTEVVRDGSYEYVMRVTSNTMGFLDLKIAKKAGARVCCARSSNSSDGGSLKSKIAHIMGRVLYSRYVDVAIAPSDLAAQYTFGQRAYQNGQVHILHNAVDLAVFRYDDDARQRLREELCIPETAHVYGHVGRFMTQKNHMFLADIFVAVKKKDPDAVFLLVGDGVLKADFEQKVTQLGIRDSVILAGTRSDVPALLSAMDVFVFPSLYEGMPNTVIESQATGLPCVIADTITKEADITGLVQYLPLAASAEEWANAALAKATLLRGDTKEQFIRQHYDIDSVVSDFTNMIFR